jgi:acyl carrier protein
MAISITTSAERNQAWLEAAVPLGTPSLSTSRRLGHRRESVDEGVKMSIEQEVIELVASKTGKSRAKITPEKTFYDLGIDGDDAVELIDELCERYQVPVEGVELRKYIGPEGAFTVANHVFNAVARKGGTERKELKISNLIKTAEDHRWFDASL